MCIRDRLYIGGSIFILIDPIDSEISLTLFAGVLLLVEGVMELASGAAASGPASGLIVVDGILTALFGVLLVVEWPSDSLWALGTLFGAALFLSALNLFRAPAEQSGSRWRNAETPDAGACGNPGVIRWKQPSAW